MKMYQLKKWLQQRNKESLRESWGDRSYRFYEGENSAFEETINKLFELEEPSLELFELGKMVERWDELVKWLYERWKKSTYILTKCNNEGFTCLFYEGRCSAFEEVLIEMNKEKIEWEKNLKEYVFCLNEKWRPIFKEAEDIVKEFKVKKENKDVV